MFCKTWNRKKYKKMGVKHPLIIECRVFRKPFHAREAARDASTTVKRVHVYIEKTTEKQRNRIKTREELLLYVWYFSFASGWQAKNCCSLFYRAFIINNSTLGVIPSVILNLSYSRFFKAFSCIISKHIICIRKLCKICSCNSCIFSAKIFSDLFNNYIMMTTSCLLHLEYNFL